MSQGEQNGNPTTNTPIPLPQVSPISADSKPFSKGIRVSSILQGLLDEHKAQSLIVASLKEEINYLKQNPALYFQSRKRFLYHAYTQTLSKCQAQMKFEVQVCSNVSRLTQARCKLCFHRQRGRSCLRSYLSNQS
jgi:hypothetical protein